LKNAITTLTTTSDNPCVNYCSDKGPYVVGLAGGTENICLCDSKYEDLYWNTSTLKC
jgi:hypothetical protein